MNILVLALLRGVQGNAGFCPGGAVQPAPYETWGSYCADGDRTTGHAATQSFRFDGSFQMYVAGYPNDKGMSLRLENLSTHESLGIHPVVQCDCWQRLDLKLPDSWRGRDLRIYAEDSSIDPRGWVAFSLPTSSKPSAMWRDAKKILLKTPLFALLIFLPGFALASVAVRKGVRGTLKLGMIVLAGVAVPGYLLFAVYFVSAKAGYWVAAVLPFVYAGTLLFQIVKLGPGKGRRLVPLLIPFGLTLTAAAFVLSLGYEYGGLEMPNSTPQVRFQHPLPPDNEIPFLFAEGLRKGSVPSPLIGNWLASDRPPLQTGMILTLEPFMRTQRELWTHVASAVMQSLWVFAAWLLLRALRCSRLSTGLVLLTTCLSGVVIVNTFYVWPKLLASAYTAALAIPVLAGIYRGRRSWLLRALMAFLLVCGQLSHGGSAFALLGLLLFSVVRPPHSAKKFREICVVGAMAILLYLPWVAYQKFVDPPGDRLVKLWLAGVEQPTNSSALQAVYDAYRKQTFRQWLAVKDSNVGMMVEHQLEYLKALSNVEEPKSRYDVRILEFFFLVPSIGLAAFGVLGLCVRWTKRRATNEQRAAERLLQVSAYIAISWLLLMFSPSSTVLHQGTYVLVLLALAGCILGLWILSPRLAVGLCLLQCFINWFVYQSDLSAYRTPNAVGLNPNVWMVALQVASLCVFAIVLAGEPALTRKLWFPRLNTPKAR